MGILANSASVTHSSSSATDTKSGYVINERITLSTSPTQASYSWGMSKPSGSTARSVLSDTTSATPTVVPDVAGTYVFVEGTSGFILTITVVAVEMTSVSNAHRFSPIADASIPTPALGRTLYYSSNASDLVTKDSAGIVAPLGGDLAQATIATLPTASTSTGRAYFVSDEATGPVLVFSDGSKWRRSTDREIARSLPKTIVINGQSNAASGPPVPYGYSSIVPLLGPDLLGFNYTTQTFTQVVDGTANARANFGGAGTGPGPGAGGIGARVMRMIATATGQTVRSYAAAFTAQAIGYFLPNSVTLAKFEDGTSHPTLNNYNWVAAMVTAGGFVPTEYIYIQGEADAGRTQASYYADLRTLFDALRVSYPGIHMTIVLTIGDENDGPTNYLSGVRAAQLQLASEEPNNVSVVDNRDMRGVTAFWDAPHYAEFNSSEIGMEETAERLFVALQGLPARPTVPSVAHIRDVLLPASWEHLWVYNRAITNVAGADRVTQWNDVQGTDHLIVGAGNGGVHNPRDSELGGRTSITLDPATNDHYTDASSTGSNILSFFAVARLDSTLADGLNVWLVQFEPAAGGNRIGLDLVTPAFAGAPSVFVEGNGSIQFSGAPFLFDKTWRTYGFTYDGPAGTARFYVSGQLVSTVTGLNNHTLDPMRIRVGGFSGVQTWKGRIAMAAVKVGTLVNDTQMAAAHRWAEVEFKLAT